MGIFYNLFHKDKDIELRGCSLYLELSKLDYIISDILSDNNNYGTVFEKIIDGYYYNIFIAQRKIVLTVFFDLDDKTFKELLNTVIDKLFKEHTWCGRNFIEDRIKFNKFHKTENIDNQLRELIEVVKKEKFPPQLKEKVVLLRNQELK